MTKTVDDLRNEIRVAVGRFERETAAAFTKEDLRDVSEAVGHEVDATGRLPPKAEMRAGILAQLPDREGPAPATADRPFRKEELAAIHEAVTDD